ncbi:MAG: ECF transporter S component [Actinobacteria bacterium]|nr:MAG: ECF transporter S component [Actinomycetota bacterium]
MKPLVLAAAVLRGLLEPGLVTILAATAFLAACYSILAARLSSKEIAVVATLGALSSAGRVAFAAVPSVQPSTVLVILSGYVFGPGPGFLVGATTALVSNLFLGQGPWTVWQMLSWGAIGALAGLLGRVVPVPRTSVLVAFSFAAGLGFSWLMNAWFWLSFVSPRTPATLAATFAAGLWFDMLHAVGNALFALIVSARAVRILAGFRSRFRVTFTEVST